VNPVRPIFFLQTPHFLFFGFEGLPGVPIQESGVPGVCKEATVFIESLFRNRFVLEIVIGEETFCWELLMEIGGVRFVCCCCCCSCDVADNGAVVAIGIVLLLLTTDDELGDTCVLILLFSVEEEGGGGGGAEEDCCC